jgi:hypothetical protein
MEDHEMAGNEGATPVTTKPASLVSILLKSTGSVLLCAFVIWCIVFRESAGDQLIRSVLSWLYDNGWVSFTHYYNAFSQVPWLPEVLAGGFFVSYIWLITVLAAMDKNGLNERPLYRRMEWVSLRAGLLATVALWLYTPISPSPVVVGTVATLIAFMAIVDWSHNSSSARLRI